MYLDTGAMYRAVALLFIRSEIEPESEKVDQLLANHSIRIAWLSDSMRVYIDSEDVTSFIRTPRITELSSRVSALPAVRTKLVAEQRKMAREQVSRGSGVVMEGRDIGTVVFPNADVKIYLGAEAEERASRRVRQIRENGGKADFDQILAEIKARDARDETRSTSPLAKADDAVYVDTTDLSFDEQVAMLEDLIRERE